jgi:hypothetical protein
MVRKEWQGRFLAASSLERKREDRDPKGDKPKC